MPAVKKTVWTLNIGGYAPQITQMTYPLLYAYAKKIGADFRIINERRFPDMPVTYEKMQIFELGRENDWNIYVDGDAVILPDMIDVTERVPKDTVVHYGHDHASNRFRYDDCFRRDGRDIGSCNWFAAASNWCMDLWHPLDIPLADALDRIKPILVERLTGITREHLIDDYTLSRNIARFGLKFKTVAQILKEDNDSGIYVWHTHRESVDAKAAQIAAGLKGSHLDELEELQYGKEMRPWDWMARHAVNPPTVPTAAIEPVDISRAEKIFGWMHPAELLWLAYQARKHKVIVEIGSFQGRSTRALADNTDGVVYAIDTWEGSPEHQSMPESKNLLSRFCSNMEDLRNVVPLELDSLSGAQWAKTLHPDMIFIDARHDYESVKADVEAWRPLLAPGGLLCGHDFGDVPNTNTPTDEEWGVARAVQDLIPDFQRGAGSIWYAPPASAEAMAGKPLKADKSAVARAGSEG
jgi:predicted O-methyltransferase YrrM